MNVTLDKRKSKLVNVKGSTGLLDISSLPELTRNVSETQLLALKTAGSVSNHLHPPLCLPPPSPSTSSPSPPLTIFISLSTYYLFLFLPFFVLSIPYFSSFSHLLLYFSFFLSHSFSLSFFPPFSLSSSLLSFSSPSSSFFIPFLIIYIYYAKRFIEIKIPLLNSRYKSSEQHVRAV